MPVGNTLNGLEQAMIDMIEEHTAMRERLWELEEVRSDAKGRLYWVGSGNYLSRKLGDVKGEEDE